MEGNLIIREGKLSNLKPNGVQQIILIATAILLLIVSFDSNDVHFAKVIGIVSASAFLIYGCGQFSISRPQWFTYQNIKRFLYCCLLIVIGIATVIASNQVYQAYKSKAEQARYSKELAEIEAKKTPKQKGIENAEREYGNKIFYENMAKEEAAKKKATKNSDGWFKR